MRYPRSLGTMECTHLKKSAPEHYSRSDADARRGRTMFRYFRDRVIIVPYLLLFVIMNRQYFLHLDTRTAAVSLKYFVLALHILPHRMTGHDSFTKWIVASKGGWMIKNDLSESICQLALMLG